MHPLKTKIPNRLNMVTLSPLGDHFKLSKIPNISHILEQFSGEEHNISNFFFSIELWTTLLYICQEYSEPVHQPLQQKRREQLIQISPFFLISRYFNVFSFENLIIFYFFLNLPY